jgi:hypothetical protein
MAGEVADRPTEVFVPNSPGEGAAAPNAPNGLWERAWWFLLAVAIVLVLMGYTAISALGAQLSAMHPLNGSSASLGGLFGVSHLGDAVKTWRDFWFAGNDVLRGATQTHYKSPLWLAELALLLDMLILIPGYVAAGIILLIRADEGAPAHLEPILGLGVVTLVAAGVADFGEDIFSWFIVNGYWADSNYTPHFLGILLRAASIAKGVLLLLVVLALLLAALAKWRQRGEETRTALYLTKIQLLVTIVAFAAFFISLQLTDLLSRLSSHQAVFLIVAAVVLGLVVWSTARTLVHLHEHRSPSPGTPNKWLSMGMFVGPLAAFGLWNLIWGAGSWAALIPAGLVLLLFVLGRPLEDAPFSRHPMPAGQMGVALPAALAAGCVLAAGLAALRVAVASYVQIGQLNVLLVVSIALGVLALGTIVAAWFVETYWPGAHLFLPTMWVGAMLVLVAYVVLLAQPVTAPQAFGGISIVLLFLTAATFVLAGLALFADWWVDRFGVPAAFRPFRSRAIPILSLLLIWGILAPKAGNQDHWNVRTTADSQSDAGVSVQSAMLAWMNQAEKRSEVPEGTGSRAAIPLVMVSSWGGGIRSAYWTALVMDCVFGGHIAGGASSKAGDPCATDGPRVPSPQDVFLASGVSGGSVGLVEWDAIQDLPWMDSWVNNHLGADFVSPSMARGLLVEVPRSFLQFAAPGRDDVLEEAWEREWADVKPNPMTEGFLAGEQERMRQGGPFLLLNGSSVMDGCSLSVSLMDLGSTVDQVGTSESQSLSMGDCLSYSRYLEARDGAREPPGPLPGTADLVDFLGCSAGATDVRRSTAALLSARFPYVSSAGRLAACHPEGSTKFIIDGGVVDDSGDEAALAVWKAIEPMINEHNATSQQSCVIPYFLQVNNGYLPGGAPAADPSAPNQLLAPPIALKHSTGLEARASRAQSMAADLFTQPFSLTGIQGSVTASAPTGPSSRYAMIVPHGHPGLEASLGWTLSTASKADLMEQLYVVNAPTITEVRRWLTDPPACPAAALAGESSAHG